jgi:hypothetical protein
MKSLLTVSATAATAVTLVLSGAPLAMTAQASPDRQRPPVVGSGCNPSKNHAEKRSVTTFHSHPVVTHGVERFVAANGRLNKEVKTAERRQVTTNLSGAAGATGEVAGIWDFIAAKVGGHFGVKVARQTVTTTKKAVKVDVDIHNNTSKQHSYVVFAGVSSFTGSYTVIYCKGTNGSQFVGNFVKGHGSYTTFPTTEGSGFARCGGGSGGSALVAEALKEMCH